MEHKNMNVIFIMTDQQRADSIGPNRHPCADFPNMEKLRSESVCFENFYTAALPCVPSRHSFLTGRNPWILGCSGNGKFFTDDRETTWMSILRDNGYHCVSVGKTHMIHAGSFHIQVPSGNTFGDQGGWNHFNPCASPVSEEQYFDIHTTRRACDALDRLDETHPFAMFIGFHAPHEPYIMPEKYVSFCDPKDAPLPKARADGEYETKSSRYKQRVDHFKNLFGDISDEMVRNGVAGHHCMLKMVDDCLGKIVEKLENLKLLDNTLIIYTSDHGEMLGEHWIFNKAASFYEGETHIPFMIRYPDKSKAGTSVESLASSLDFFPTLMEILNLSPDISLPGHSLVPAIEEGKRTRNYVTSAINGLMMIRTEKYKLWYDPLNKDGEMYNFEVDPFELDNLYNKPEHTELRHKLVELMLHARLTDDNRNNVTTKREKRLRMEVKASYEPEVNM